MSIRATVGTILPSGLLQVIFVESGGLPSQLGEILQRNCWDQGKIEELLNLGSLYEVVDELTFPTDSSLKAHFVLGHFVGEISENVPELHFYEDVALWLGDADGCEYAYFFKENAWKTFERKFSIRRQTSTVEVHSFWVDEHGVRVTRPAGLADRGL